MTWGLVNLRGNFTLLYHNTTVTDEQFPLSSLGLFLVAMTEKYHTCKQREQKDKFWSLFYHKSSVCERF